MSRFPSWHSNRVEYRLDVAPDSVGQVGVFALLGSVEDAGGYAYRGRDPELPYEVRQAGERTLWDEVQAAYRWWIDVGRPAVDAWQFAVSSTGQRTEFAGPGDAHTLLRSGEI